MATQVTNPAPRKSLKKIKDSTLYYEHQTTGVRTMARMNSFLLADEMGLGKSLQALTVAAIDFELNMATNVLIVSPATLKWNWEDEINQHTNFSCLVLHGTPDQRVMQLSEFVIQGYDILIVNYEQVSAHLDLLNALSFDIVIFDEAHYIKNRKAARTKAALKVHARRSFLLTGSPLLNQVNELWTLLHRISPSEYPDYWRFVNRYCNTPDAPIWMADGTFKLLKDIEIGDVVMGWDETASHRTLIPSMVTGRLDRIAPEIIEATMESGRKIKCTPDHVWLSGNHNPYHTWTRVRSHVKTRKGTLSFVVDPPRLLAPDEQRIADWLSGMYDGEGSGYSISQSQSHNPEICERIAESLTILGIPFSRTDKTFNLVGGRQTYVNILNWMNLSKREYLQKRLFSRLNRTKDRVDKVERLGPGEVVSLETTSGNYIAWGYASKNCLMGGYKGKQIVGVKHPKELQDRLGRVMIRRLKKDVLDLPEKQHITVSVDFHPEQERLYKQVNEELQLERFVGDPDPVVVENALSKALRLKQICGTTFSFTHEDHSHKLDRAVEMCQEFVHDEPDNPGENVVVFTQFRDVQSCFVDRLNKVGIQTFILNGDVPKPERAEVVRSWAQYKEATGKPAILVAMLQVAGIGLNMTAAKKCVFLDKLWVPKLNEQAEDRLHRIGADTTQPIQIFHMIVKGSIEHRIETILRRKTKLFNSLVEESSWKKELYKALAEEEYNNAA